MRLRLNALAERTRASLFFIPMLSVIAAVVAGWLALSWDRHLDQSPEGLPFGLVTTVDGARSLLSTIAGATITFAGIAFSVSLLIIQQAASQYSPRVVHTLFRDPFNKRVMGLVVGTFTFCVVVLRSVRGPLDQGGDPIIPNVSVAIAVVLGVTTILAIVAFINHSAHSMDVSEILERVRNETIETVRRTWREPEHQGSATGRRGEEPPPDTADWCRIRFRASGWIQQIDYDALLEGIDDGAILRLETRPGRYAVDGSVVALTHPAPADREALQEAVNDAVAVGATRTMQQDASYGLRQLADVALKALSPGVNDPTTAQDATFHTAAVLAEMLRRDPPQPAISTRDGRRLVDAQRLTPAELVGLAFDETRRASAGLPAMCGYLLEALALVAEPLLACGLPDRAEPLHVQATLVLDGCRTAELGADDLRTVEAAYERHFGEGSPAARAR